jgi:hypothetical protein
VKSDDPAAEVRCENCGAALSGPYCASCGQPARSPIRTVRAFASEVLRDLASLDSRFARTVYALFLRPGHLTREYLAGRRVRYSQPVQLYIVAAAAFFLVGTYRPFVWIDTQRRVVAATLPGMEVRSEAIRERLGAIPAGPPLELFAERFVNVVSAYLPVFLIASVALFSVLVYALNVRRERRWMPHAVFALHWVAFYLPVMAAARLFPPAWLVQQMTIAVALVYLTVALRRVYGLGVGWSLAKALALLAAFLFVLALWVQSAFALAMWLL